MLTTIKTEIRDSLPRRFQVPIKYWVDKFRGNLERELQLLPDLLRGKGRFIDVGANRGVYAYATVKLSQHIELFEPNPGCAVVLNSFAKVRPNVRVHSVALSDHHGFADLRVPVDATGIEHDSSATLEKTACSFREYRVQLRTLDSFRFSDVALIKIDVEGHESHVLTGGAKTISSQMPALLIEIEQRHLERPITNVFQQVQSFGYEGFFLEGNGSLRGLSDFDILTHQAFADLDRQHRYYINNFLFLHQTRLAAGEYRFVCSRT